MNKIKKYKDFLNENQIAQPQIQVQVQPEGQSQPQVQPQVQKKSNLRLSKYANMIEYTYIKPNAPDGQIEKMIEDCKRFKFRGIVINPKMIDRIAYNLTDEDITIISMLDFPTGNANTKDKLTDTIELISDGVDEIDMVMDFKKLKKAYKETDEETKKSLLDAIENDIRTIANECHKNGVILKVIMESGELTLEEVVLACELISNAGADFVQTSTGTRMVGSELSKVKEMRRVLPDYVKIKVSGGIRTLEQCEMYYPFIDRIGTSVIPK
jgi:deoxyribose-phosphate aldolase